jgi:hypothetical protein
MTTLVLISYAMSCLGIAATIVAATCLGSTYGDCFTDGDECGLDL